MATGSGTGTPASGSSSATLSTIRARVLQQITSPDQDIDYTAVTASALTLTTMRDRVEVVLQDSSNVKWAVGDLEEAIRQALEQYSRKKPNHALTTLTLSANGREIDISSITGLVRVEHVWWDYDSSSPGHPPQWRHFEVWPGKLMYINDPSEPQSGDKVRVQYTKEHTINGLDSANATTFPVDDESFLIHGAAAFATRFRAIEISEQANVDDKVYARLQDWATTAMKEFTEGLRQRYRRGRVMDFDQDDLDEAIRWALHRLNEVSADKTLVSVTLTGDGREVDISSLTDLLQVQRVWWDYDSSDPEHPPQWRDFEVWPGDILYIDDGDEPETGEVVRILYTRLHTLNGLDNASTTTLPADFETLIVVGAGGFACQERTMDEEGRYTPYKLREWAAKRLSEFERGLKRLARHSAIRNSGIAAGPALDRWDNSYNDGWC